MPETLFITIGIILIMLGLFILVFLGIMRSVQQSAGKEEKAEVKTGGVIMIGPIPVVFGSDKRSALIAIVFVILLMLLTIMFLKL